MLQSQTQTPLAVPTRADFAFESSNLAQKRLEIAQWVKEGHLDMARQQAQRAVALYPESPDLLVIHALVCEMQHDWDAAAQSLEKLVEILQPLVPEPTWHHLIRVQRCQGKPGVALKTAFHALRQFPASTVINQEFDLLCAETTSEV